MVVLLHFSITRQSILFVLNRIEMQQRVSALKTNGKVGSRMGKFEVRIDLADEKASCSKR